MLAQPLVASYMHMLPMVQASLGTTDLSVEQAFAFIDEYHRPLTDRINPDSNQIPTAFKTVSDAIVSDNKIMRMSQELFWKAVGTRPRGRPRKIASKMAYEDLISVLKQRGALVPFIDQLRREKGLPPIDWHEAPDIVLIWGRKNNRGGSLQGLNAKLPSELGLIDHKIGSRQFALNFCWDQTELDYKLTLAQGASSQQLALSYVSSRVNRETFCVFEKLVLCSNLGLSKSLLEGENLFDVFLHSLKKGSDFLQRLWHVKRAVSVNSSICPKRLYLSGRLYQSKKAGGALKLRNIDITEQKPASSNLSFVLEFVWDERENAYRLEATNDAEVVDKMRDTYPLVGKDILYKKIYQYDGVLVGQLQSELAEKGSKFLEEMWGRKKTIYTDLPERPERLYLTGRVLEKTAGKQKGCKYVRQLTLTSEEIDYDFHDFCLCFVWDNEKGGYCLDFEKNIGSELLGPFYPLLSPKVIYARSLFCNASSVIDLQTKLQEQGSALLSYLWQIKYNANQDLPLRPRQLFLSGRVKNNGTRDMVYSFHLTHEKPPSDTHNFVLSFVLDEQDDCYYLCSVQGPNAGLFKEVYPLIKLNVSNTFSGKDAYQYFINKLKMGSTGVLALWEQHRNESHVDLPENPSQIVITGRIVRNNKLYDYQVYSEDSPLNLSSQHFKLVFVLDESTGGYKIKSVSGSYIYKLALIYTEAILEQTITDPVLKLVLQTLWQANLPQNEVYPLVAGIKSKFRKGSNYIEMLWQFLCRVGAGLPESPDELFIGVGFQESAGRVNQLLITHEKAGLSDLLSKKNSYYFSLKRFSQTREYYIDSLDSSAVADIAFSYVLAKYPHSYEFELAEKLVLMKMWQTDLPAHSDLRTLSVVECVDLIRAGSLKIEKLSDCLNKANPFRLRRPEKLYLVGVYAGRTSQYKSIGGFALLTEEELSQFNLHGYFKVPLIWQNDQYVINEMPNNGISAQMSRVYGQPIANFKLSSLHPQTSKLLLKSVLADPSIFEQLAIELLVKAGILSKEIPLLPFDFFLLADSFWQGSQLFLDNVRAGLEDDLDSDVSLNYRYSRGKLSLMHMRGW